MQDLLLGLGYFLEMVIGLAVLLLVLFLISRVISWAIYDAKRRGKSPILVCVAVLLFFPWGLVAWLIFRPEPTLRSFVPSPR